MSQTSREVKCYVLVAFGYTGYLLTGDERAYAGLGITQAVAD